MLDTGVGGLTVYDALRRVLPEAPVIFAADFVGMPYGKKTEAEVAARVAGLLGRMSERYRPRLACIACNTASTIALGMVRDVLEIPVVGTVPAVKPAALHTQTGTFGMIGTQATIRQRYVDDLERDFASDKTLLRIAAPDLVDEAEAKLRGKPVNLGVVEEAVTRLRGMEGGNAIDAVVLACTHFPLLREELGALFGSDVALIDGAEGIARRIVHLLNGQEFERSGPNRFVVTGPVERAQGLENTLSERGFGAPETF
ncbi:glutamate racemase [uncultured Erythrobacter sp.]|uniref:glutamate racemase n=1 Tax=uncultured Erythrobacter sp. TaxID=263913 RepID=UPI002626A4D2|nr:glutamate racemase [uncultured Erythrobacter sp.]